MFEYSSRFKTTKIILRCTFLPTDKSYQWYGEQYSNKTRYQSSLYEAYQHLDKIGPYKDSLFAFMEIDIKNHQMKIEGIQSEWMAPSPDEFHVPKQVYGMEYSANISDRLLGLE